MDQSDRIRENFRMRYSGEVAGLAIGVDPLLLDNDCRRKRESEQSAAATAAATRGASVTVIPRNNRTIHDVLQRKSGDGQSFTGAIGERQIQHLIEIAVVHR